MKKSNKFVRSYLDEIAARIPGIILEYEYDDFDDTHCIKVKPKELYDDPAYMEAESDMIDAFVEQFPFEGIVFITDGDIIDIDEVQYTTGGV